MPFMMHDPSVTQCNLLTRNDRICDVVASALQAGRGGRIEAHLEKAAEHDTVDATLDLQASTAVSVRVGNEGLQQTLAFAPVTSAVEKSFGYFGDYELLTEIARGGMGVVFKARQKRLDRIVALKMIISGDLAGAEEVQRFKAEAEAVAQLDHPHIVPVFDVGEINGRNYLTMGFVEGQSLKQRLSEGPLSPRESAEMMATVAAAIQHAHEQQIIHRDLKPANILLDQSGQPRVTDFGLAKRAGRDSGLTATGQVMGTPSYMPPEQASGRASGVGPLADVYSLGATLYHVLTGRPPHQAATVVQTLKQVLHEEPLPLRQLNTAVPRDLETICLKCLEKAPEKRFSSAKQLVEELQRYLRGEPILSRPVRRAERLWRWCRRNAKLAIASGIAAGGLLAATVTLSISVLLINNSRNDTMILLHSNQRMLELFQLEREGIEEQLHEARSAVAKLRQNQEESDLPVPATLSRADDMRP